MFYRILNKGKYIEGVYFSSLLNDRSEIFVHVRYTNNSYWRYARPSGITLIEVAF